LIPRFATLACARGRHDSNSEIVAIDPAAPGFFPPARHRNCATIGSVNQRLGNWLRDMHLLAAGHRKTARHPHARAHLCFLTDSFCRLGQVRLWQGTPVSAFAGSLAVAADAAHAALLGNTSNGL
jgi:hypothetical protein